MKPEDNYPSDLGMVPTGTKCGSGMVRQLPVAAVNSINKASVCCHLSGLTLSSPVCQVCYSKRCQDMRKINAYGTIDCAEKCNNNGVSSGLMSQQLCSAVAEHVMTAF